MLELGPTVLLLKDRNSLMCSAGSYPEVTFNHQLKGKSCSGNGAGEKATHLERAESVITKPGYRKPKRAPLALSKGLKGNKKGIYKYEKKIDF